MGLDLVDVVFITIAFSSPSQLAVAKEVEKYAIPFMATEKITYCQDPDDNMILELAIASQASCIITGDPHLLTLHPFRGIPILRANDFLINF